MGYYPTPSKSSSGGSSSSGSSGSSSKSSSSGSKTDTDKRVEASPKYVGSKWMPSQQSAGTPVQTIQVSGSGSSAKTIAASGATAADVQKFQQNVQPQKTSNIVSNIPQGSSSRGAQAAANFQKNYITPPQQNVSVPPGVNPNLPQGGYIVNTRQGYKSEVRYLEPTPENLKTARREAAYQGGRLSGMKEQAKQVFESEQGRKTANLALFAFPEAKIAQLLGRGGKVAITVAETAKGAKVVEATKTAAPSLIKRASVYTTERVVPKVVSVYDKVSPTRTYKWVKGAVGGIATAEVVSTGIREGSSLSLTQEQRAIRAEPGFKAAVGSAYAETGKEQFNQAWYKGVAYQIPGVPLAMGREGFEQQLRANFEAQGYTSAEVDKRVAVGMGELYAGQIGESAGFLSISKTSEGIGRGLIAGTFKQAAVKGETATTKTVGLTLFKKTAPSIAAAGVVEGVGGELVQERSRQQTLSGQQLALMGLFGGASAGVIGGTIAGTSVKRPLVSKTIETAAYISDPFEKPGDLLQNAAEFSAKKFYGTEAPKPSIYQTVKPEDIIGFGTGGKKPVMQKPSPVYSFGMPGVTPPTGTPVQTTTPTTAGYTYGTATSRVSTPPVPPFTPSIPENSIIMSPIEVPSRDKRGGGRGGGGSVTPVQIYTPVSIPVISPTPTPSYRTPTIIPNINIPTNPFTPVPTQPRSNVPTNPFTPVPTTPTNNVPTNPFTNVPVDTFTSIPVNPFTTINIPTTVPVGRIPPPMPLSFGDVFGGGRSGIGQRKRYVNELAAGSAILNSIMTSRPIKKPKSAAKPKKKATKHKKRKDER